MSELTSVKNEVYLQTTLEQCTSIYEIFKNDLKSIVSLRHHKHMKVINREVKVTMCKKG